MSTPTPTPDANLLDAYSQAVIHAVDVAGPSVVHITARRRGQSGVGSGIVARPDGFIVTNHHVVADAGELEVAFADGRRFPAATIGSDPTRDLALLHIAGSDWPAARFADSDAVRVGTLVVAIGNPLGLDFSVTTGVISAKHRSLPQRGGAIRDLLQTDASINPGNSGGPLVNAAGETVGINTAIISGAQGLGFAVPANTVRAFLARHAASGRTERAWLGVYGVPQALADGTNGLMLLQIAPDSPAERAGLQPLDVVLGVEGRAVTGVESLSERIESLPIGERLTLQVQRGGERFARTLTVVPAPH